MHSLSTAIEFAITVLALAGSAHGLAVPATEAGHSSHEHRMGIDEKPVGVIIQEAMQNITNLHNMTLPAETTANSTASSAIWLEELVHQLGKPIKAIIMEVAQTASHYHVTLPIKTVASSTASNTISLSELSQQLGKPVEVIIMEAMQNAGHYNITIPTSTANSTTPQAREQWDKDGNNSCLYTKINDDLFRRWEVMSPRVPDDQITSICGGLWDNLKQFAMCWNPLASYCGPRHGKHADQPGLEWELDTQGLCNSGMMGAEEEWFGNMYCQQMPVGGDIHVGNPVQDALDFYVKDLFDLGYRDKTE